MKLFHYHILLAAVMSFSSQLSASDIPYQYVCHKNTVDSKGSKSETCFYAELVERSEQVAGDKLFITLKVRKILKTEIDLDDPTCSFEIGNGYRFYYDESGTKKLIKDELGRKVATSLDSERDSHNGVEVKPDRMFEFTEEKSNVTIEYFDSVEDFQNAYTKRWIVISSYVYQGRPVKQSFSRWNYKQVSNASCVTFNL